MLLLQPRSGKRLSRNVRAGHSVVIAATGTSNAASSVIPKITSVGKALADDEQRDAVVSLLLLPVWAAGSRVESITCSRGEDEERERPVLLAASASG